MKSIILDMLKKHGKNPINLMDIEQKMPGDAKEKFEKAIWALEDSGILIPKPKKGSRGKVRPIYYVYGVNQDLLKADYIEKIHTFQRQAAPGIDLKYYLTHSETIWQKDLPFLKQIDTYLKSYGFPQEEATSPERSYALTQNEKWIDEEGGHKLLKRINLWDEMKISKYPDPLMIAVNREALGKHSHKHLIVENKSTYYLLLDVLKETSFTSLIYGCGWKVVAGLEGTYKQLGIEEDESTFYYFGDLDHEGMAIYNNISDKVNLAIPFYEALLKKEASCGKWNQTKREIVLEAFSKNFEPQDAILIRKQLQEGFYYPQEAIRKEDILEIWRKLECI